MTRILIIGVGNTLRQDDGIGVVAAQELNKTLQHSDVQILVRQQLTPELAQNMSEAEKVIIIDAEQGKTPGEVTERRIRPKQAQVLTHDVDPAGLLAYSRELYGKCPETIVITVAGRSFDFGENLSVAVARALPEIIHRTMRLAS